VFSSKGKYKHADGAVLLFAAVGLVARQKNVSEVRNEGKNEA
jgi:hypothetical protein